MLKCVNNPNFLTVALRQSTHPSVQIQVESLGQLLLSLVYVVTVARIVQQGLRHLKIWFAKGTQIPSLPVGQLPGVRVIQQESGSLHLAYQGSVGPVLKWLAHYHVNRISTRQTSLEEAFIQYYSKNGSSGMTTHRDTGPKEVTHEQ